jgi:hypothetical protein
MVLRRRIVWNRTAFKTLVHLLTKTIKCDEDERAVTVSAPAGNKQGLRHACLFGMRCGCFRAGRDLYLAVPPGPVANFVTLPK